MSSSRPRIYLDNAATSWPKPDEVYAAVDHYQRRIGAPSGRGGYAEAVEVGRILLQARTGLARLIGARDSRSIVFANSGTDALNTALYGLLRDGDHVVSSELEHNSVLRPLRHLEKTRRIAITRVCSNFAGWVDPDDVRKAVQRSTRLVVITHASNVTGVVQSIAEIARIAHEHGALLLVDAAQTVGHLPLSVEQMGCDLLAAPGHKGLLGPLGTGFLYLAPGIETQIESFRQGGTGTRSNEDVQPESLPDKFEAGNLNVPGLFGLNAGISYLEKRGVTDVHTHESALAAHLIAGLLETEGVQIYPELLTADRVAVVSFNLAGYDPQELAAMLDTALRIQVRAGFHCAMLMHRALQTVDRGGTVRMSIGAFNTCEQVDAVIAAVGEIGMLDP